MNQKPLIALVFIISVITAGRYISATFFFDKTPRPFQTAVINASTAEGIILTGGRLNINTATAADLEVLSGIGPALAGRIVARRNAKGAFQTPEELMDVKGIGPAKLAKIRRFIDIK